MREACLAHTHTHAHTHTLSFALTRSHAHLSYTHSGAGIGYLNGSQELSVMKRIQEIHDQPERASISTTKHEPFLAILE